MIRGKIFVCLVLLATANYMVAQESRQHNEESPQGVQSLNPKHFGSLTDFFDFFNFGRREAVGESGPGDENVGQRDANDESGPRDDDNAAGPQSRFFFSSFFNTRLVSCNFTSQAGSTCLTCSQVLRCLPSDAGTLKTCHGFFPYCNGGRCSLFPEANCTTTG